MAHPHRLLRLPDGGKASLPKVKCRRGVLMKPFIMVCESLAGRLSEEICWKGKDR